MKSEIPTTEPYQDFLFAMNRAVNRERCRQSRRALFVHISIECATMEERCRKFVEAVKESGKNGNSKCGYA